MSPISELVLRHAADPQFRDLFKNPSGSSPENESAADADIVRFEFPGR